MWGGQRCSACSLGGCFPGGGAQAAQQLKCATAGLRRFDRDGQHQSLRLRPPGLGCGESRYTGRFGLLGCLLYVPNVCTQACTPRSPNSGRFVGSSVTAAVGYDLHRESIAQNEDTVVLRIVFISPGQAPCIRPAARQDLSGQDWQHQ